MLEIVTVALIAFGLAYTMAKLDGPFGLAGAVQAWSQRPERPLWVRNGAGCVFCWSFWCALPTAIVLTGGVSGWMFVTWLAGFGLACFLFLYTGH